MKHNNEDNTIYNGTVGLKPEQKVLLHKSIANYLELSGFKKTLKKFCSEAQIAVGLSLITPFACVLIECVLIECISLS